MLITGNPGRFVFPNQCVACGRLPARAHKIEVWRGFDALFVRSGISLDVPVPTCRKCSNTRTLVGVVAHIAVFAAAIWCIIAAFGAWDRQSMFLGYSLFVLFLLGIFGSRNWLSPFVDGLILGVRGVDVREKENVITLDVRDEQVAAHLQRGLTATSSNSALQPTPTRAT